MSDNNEESALRGQGEESNHDAASSAEPLPNNQTAEPLRRRTARTVEEFKDLLIDNLYFTHGQALQTSTPTDAYLALCYTVRDHLMERYRTTSQVDYRANPKFVYYLSMEYLLGRQLPQNMLYTNTEELARGALAEYGLDLDRLIQLVRRLRDSIPVRHLPPGVPRRLAVRVSRRLDLDGESLGVRAPG